MRQRSHVGLAASVVALLALVAIELFQRYGRKLYDSHATQEAATSIGFTLDAFPETDKGTFLREQHDRCFERTYTLSWVWNSFDELAYLRCLEEGYAAQMEQALVLEDPAWTPHTDPRWARLEFTVRLQKGRLPGRVGTTTVAQCGSGGASSSTSEILPRDFVEVTPGVYRSHTLVGLRRGSCQVQFGLVSGHWLLSPPLVVPLPTPDPVLMQARSEQERRDREAEQRTWQCVLVAKAGLAAVEPAYTDEGTDPLSDAVRRLRSSDVSVRHEGALALKSLGPESRSAIGELVRSLGDTNENSKDLVIQALVAADPDGRDVTPALRCLAEEPKAQVRVWAGVALVALKDPAGLAMLEREIRSPDEAIRLAVVHRIRHSAARGKGLASLLVARLQSEDSIRVRTACIQTLPWIDPHSNEVTAALNTALQDTAPEVREAATVSLRDLQSIRARPEFSTGGP